ncbi:hypothetical protein GCM10018781_32610 [Kitasatospora indigofera]|uniref:Helix-turn-helix domain-containing protein n=1 Tax=Kitasatospora indigofera TaxID=67307 RepID=A0A919FSV1_9ACTN|nr:helix-turn-helix domain-containing protein [Kitasatospora indigofera]GHH71388.1 hypothetical protein GCM10018781_32610 [Kitasatospora indigofera]
MTTAVPQALTVKDVMAALRVSHSKVYDLINTNALPSFTVGRSRRFDAADVTAYMHKRKEDKD